MDITYHTVIYRIEEGVHAAWWQSIQPLFMADGAISVIAVAGFDALEKLEGLERSERLIERVQDDAEAAMRVVGGVR